MVSHYRLHPEVVFFNFGSMHTAEDRKFVHNDHIDIAQSEWHSSRLLLCCGQNKLFFLTKKEKYSKVTVETLLHLASAGT